MIIYLCIKFEFNTLIFSKDIKRIPFFNYFSTLIKGRNSKNNWWVLPLIVLDLHFMIIHLCIKFESNTLILSKDIKRKPFFNYFSTLIKGRNSKNNWWILPSIELDLYFIIICLCIKYESNTLIFSKVMARKPFFKVEKGP